MHRTIALTLTLATLTTGVLHAQDAAKDAAKKAKIASALGAAPASVTDKATVMDWDNTTLRPGTNGWTCFPDMPDTKGTDPMCLDAPWVNWVHAWMTKTQPTFKKIGIGYMLRGSSGAESNTDPYAEGPTAHNEWMEGSVPHIMLIVPDPAMLEGLPTDPKNGGPWVMWRDTPYVHIMVPTPEMGSPMPMRH